MSHSVTLVELNQLSKFFDERNNSLNWSSVFVLPGWLQAWWDSFGSNFTALPLLIHSDREVIGFAPLKLSGKKASLIGDNSVCDYLDFTIADGAGEAVASALLDYLSSRGICELELETLRPGAVALTCVMPEALRRGWHVNSYALDMSYETELPKSYGDYLISLESRYRRDLERKLRNIETFAPVRLEVLHDSNIGEADLLDFFGMMSESRYDKSLFLTDEMKRFFSGVALAMASCGAMRLAFLCLGATRVAATFFFDYGDRIYLYNSGYLPQYTSMSVGLISKLFTIRFAIDEGKKVFDFLKGSEVYKSRMGGKRVQLMRCDIRIPG